MQHGVLSRAQLLAAGLDVRAIDYRIAIERLQPIHRGVYAIGHLPSSPLAYDFAAVLACGPQAVLSHRSAAALWRIAPGWWAPVEVIARGKHFHRGVLAHRSRRLAEDEIATHLRIPVTTPARTLIDLADVLDDEQLARAVNQALLLQRIRLNELAVLLDRSSGRRASGRLRGMVRQSDAPTRSVFEDAFLAFTERYELPRPAVNQRVAGYEVDMLWRAQRLIVELDGYAFHSHPRGFESDRERDASLQVAGYRVVRVTWARLERRPEREAARLLALLELAAP
ncbi:MAG: DUF559 domain-containing protein [Solirubrobacteraceae bacterium]